MSSLNSLSWLKDDENLNELIKRFSLDEEMTDDEYTYLLSCSILFLKEYERDKRRSTYFEFSYFIILTYSLKTENYTPLFDLTTNFGFYPVSKYIIDNNLVPQDQLQSRFIDQQLDRFKHNDITETFEQKKYRKELIDCEDNDSCFVAPTSFGKSSLFVELINNLKMNKIAIIVPTKSLLIQTYRLINTNFENRTILFHDEMYGGEDDFIAVFTQERALRLLKDESIFFDVIIVDEAHNLFDSSPRNILLSRLLRKNRKRQPKSRFFYFSPLINDSSNLKIEEQQEITERHIQFNIKDPLLYEYRLNKKSYIYNRFVNDFFPMKEYKNICDYILSNKRENNFIYLRAPKKVEVFASELAESFNDLNNETLVSLSETISKNVHDEFYCVDLVKKGILYLHGKLPDLVKEYLEFKFRVIPEINFIIANSVILEGVNLPIDNLYILNTHDLKGKDLTNLIGRVNRLNEVFSGESHSLKKLKPRIHFVNSEEYNRKDSNMSNKMVLLKSGVFKDEVKNPTLINFDFDKFTHTIETSSSSKTVADAISKLQAATDIKDRENFLIDNGGGEENRLKAAFIEAGRHTDYSDPDHIIDLISERCKRYEQDSEWLNLRILDKIFYLFIDGFEDYILAKSLTRLNYETTRNYYTQFVNNTHSLSLKEHINSIVKYFYTISNDPLRKIFFIGSSYGEISKEAIFNEGSGSRNYIDISTKSNKELVNIALIKIKIEGDYVSYTLNQYVSLLRDMNLVSEDQYNLFIYGTSKKRNTDFTKLGLSGSLINRLESDKQLQNIEISDLGHVKANSEFKKYLEKQDDLMQFEVRKYFEV